jgi:SM-20-related protein
MFDCIVEAIADDGYAVARDFLSRDAIAALRSRAIVLERAGELAPARVGRGTKVIERSDIRGDRTCWLDEGEVDPAEAPLRSALEALRVAANRELQLGLLDFEGHYALYPAGTRYAKHRDRFRDDDARVLSVVLYLNERWCAERGGALRLHVDDRNSVDVMPEGGTLVAFLADRFMDEVLPASRARYSIAGWFRRRA